MSHIKKLLWLPTFFSSHDIIFLVCSYSLTTYTRDSDDFCWNWTSIPYKVYDKAIKIYGPMNNFLEWTFKTIFWRKMEKLCSTTKRKGNVGSVGCGKEEDVWRLNEEVNFFIRNSKINVYCVLYSTVVVLVCSSENTGIMNEWL